MKWKIILLRVFLFILVFTGTALAINYINYRGYQDAPVEVGKPSLPVVYLKYDDYMTNHMLGYRQSMNTALMRDEIIPVREDKTVSVLFRKEDAETYAGFLSYELRTLDGDSLIESGELRAGTVSDGYMEFPVTFRMDMTLEQEYYLVIRIKQDEDINIRYYARVVRLEREYLSDFISYAYAFHEASFADKTVEDETEEPEENMITEVIGTNKTSKKDTELSFVDLSSSYDAITWGNLNPVVISEVVPTIRELDSESAIIEFRYAVDSGAQGEISEYIVSEYYSLRYDNGENGVILEDFERSLDTVFEYDSISPENNSVNLGICEADEITYKASEDMRKVAFVDAGRLWFYNYKGTKISKVYGSGVEGLLDVRELQNPVGLDILSVTEDGIIDFIVYGRIGRGEHEGENAIILYEYAEENSEITELGIISCDLPYDVLQYQVGRFSYFDQEQNVFYVLLNDSVMALDIKTGQVSYVVENMPVNYIYVSESKKVMAYPNNNNPKDVTEITIWNYQTGQNMVKTASYGSRLSVIGFLGDDLIYGEAVAERVTIGADNCADFLFDHIYIANGDGEVKKDYYKENILISEVSAEENSIYLTRFLETEGGVIVETSADYMSYSREDQANGMTIRKIYNEKEYDQTHLVFPANIMVQSLPKETMTKEKQNPDRVKITVDGTTDQNLCYIFTKRGLKDSYVSAGEAVREARIEGGIVIDGNGNLIYKDKEVAPYNTIAGTFAYQNCELLEESLMACCYMSHLSAGCDADYAKICQIDDWEMSFEDEGRVKGLNLSGVDLDTALGYLSDGVPFAVKIDDGRFVLVISYNSTHIRYYDPILGQEVKVGRRGFSNSMEDNGNVVYSFMKY